MDDRECCVNGCDRRPWADDKRCRFHIEEDAWNARIARGKTRITERRLKARGFGRVDAAGRKRKRRTLRGIR